MNVMSIKEKPILFSGDMVSAILEKRKVQTRRIIKPKKSAEGLIFDLEKEYALGSEHLESLEIQGFHCENVGDGMFRVFPPCPYGNELDILWVKETWRAHEKHDKLKPSEIKNNMAADSLDVIDYKATSNDAFFWGKWRPSIFMTREFSRLDLVITDIRVERLNNISERDAIREGLEIRTDFMPGYRGSEKLPWRYEFPVDAFKDLWNFINGKNPWVWVIEFDVLD